MTHIPAGPETDTDDRDISNINGSNTDGIQQNGNSRNIDRSND